MLTVLWLIVPGYLTAMCKTCPGYQLNPPEASGTA
jgi:hypothetical protein